MRVLILLLITACACTPIKHKTIDKTYHGTNGTGSYWLAWLTQDVVKDDSVIIRITGYDVGKHQAEKVNTPALIQKDVVALKFKKRDSLGETIVRTKPGKYKIGIVPENTFYPIRTKYFKLKAGDSLTVAFISIENYPGPLIDRAQHKNGLQEYYKMVDRAEKEEAKRKRKEARKQKRKKAN